MTYCKGKRPPRGLNHPKALPTVGIDCDPPTAPLAIDEGEICPEARYISTPCGNLTVHIQT